MASKGLFKEIVGGIRVLFTPSCWIQNSRYSAPWEARLASAMETERFNKCDGYRAQLGSLSVWIENHPYASFTPGSRTLLQVRPRRITILRLMDKLDQETIEQWQVDECLDKLAAEAPHEDR